MVRVRVRAAGVLCVWESVSTQLVESVCVFEQSICGAECVGVQTDRVVRDALRVRRVRSVCGRACFEGGVWRVVFVAWGWAGDRG